VMRISLSTMAQRFSPNMNLQLLISSLYNDFRLITYLFTPQAMTYEIMTSYLEGELCTVMIQTMIQFKNTSAHTKCPWRSDKQQDGQ